MRDSDDQQESDGSVGNNEGEGESEEDDHQHLEEIQDRLNQYEEA